MEAFRSLIRGDLPPVGNPIALGKSVDHSSLLAFDGYSSSWVDSGTSALALAFLAIKALHPTINAPEVLIPGYCCPDLLAAAHYAGVAPIIVDINVDDPSLNLAALRAAISDKTLAIVAINFLGVCENYAELQQLKSEFPQLYIIEDNAQWFPGENDGRLLLGDFVAFSFGRGKPVSLLGGGLLLHKTNLPEYFFDGILATQDDASALSRVSYKGKVIAYNQLLRPYLYQMLSKNPFISLGKTQYHSLDKITALDDLRQSLVRLNLRLYNERAENTGAQYDQLFQSIGFQNSFNALYSARRRKLLRYPLLFQTVDQKQKVFPKLIQFGLGATEMYRVALPNITGVHNFSVSGSLNNAHSFAERFISLPVHSGVKPVHLELIRKAFVES